MVSMDYIKLQSDERVGVFMSPSGGALGVADVAQPTEAELNNTGGVSGMIPLSQSISWNDIELPGVQESESITEPSLADAATYVEFGPTSTGGTLSFFEPSEYDDFSNEHKIVHDLTKDIRAIRDVAVRIDGDTDALAPFEDGQYVSVSRQQLMSDANPFNLSESVRRTVGMSGKGDFSHYTIVGAHTLTVVEPDDGYAVGVPTRIRVEVQGREYTNALTFLSSDPEVVRVFPGGFVLPVATGSATVTVRDVDAGTQTTVTIAVS